jgi:CheY-like chemotaxis protein
MLLDLVMPGMDGYAVLTEMSRDSSLKHTPVIILSATDPIGQPVSISSFSLTQVKGLSIPEFLQCALALSQTLLPGAQDLA